MADKDDIGSSETDMDAPGDDGKPQKKKKGGKVIKANGKKPRHRLDKPSRGKSSGGDCYKKGGGIHIKPENKGLLHKELGVPEGKKIPEAKLEKAKHSSSAAERKRATFAENAKHWKK